MFATLIQHSGKLYPRIHSCPSTPMIPTFKQWKKKLLVQYVEVVHQVEVNILLGYWTPILFIPHAILVEKVLNACCHLSIHYCCYLNYWRLLVSQHPIAKKIKVIA